MIHLISKLNGATFRLMSDANGSPQFPLSTSCPILCSGGFDGRSLSISSAVRRADIESFKRGLERMHSELKEGRSETLWTVNGSAVLALRCEPAGQIAGEFVISSTEQGGLVRLHGRLGLDQSYLPELMQQCDALLRANYTGD